jgi:hypothetical protein
MFSYKSVSILLVNAILLASCATREPVFIESIRPPETPRLRVFIQALENDASWSTPFREYERITFAKVEKVLYDTGICEVISPDVTESSLGKSRARLPWKANGYALASKAARAVWAEYAMLVERVNNKGTFLWETTLINARTGAVFKVTMDVPGGSRSDFKPVIQASYEQLFKDAKSDMLTAAEYRRTGDAAQANASSSGKAKEISRSMTFKEPVAPSASATVLAVYDIKAVEADRLVASILSESLRSELLGLGTFRIVSRESMEDVLSEMERQLTGVVDEKLAVKAGLGLAAQQIVVSQFGGVGKIRVLQAKRIDLATQRTLSLKSIQCDLGAEEKLLEAMSSLAKELSLDL